MSDTLTFVAKEGLREALGAFVACGLAKEDLVRSSLGAAINELLARGFRSTMGQRGMAEYQGSSLRVISEKNPELVFEIVPAWIDAVRNKAGLAGSDGLPSRWKFIPVFTPTGFGIPGHEEFNLVQVEG
jgi:hypothetical protein